MECLPECQVMQLNMLLRRSAMIQNKSLHLRSMLTLMKTFYLFYFSYWNDIFGIFTVAFQSSVIVFSSFGSIMCLDYEDCGVYHTNQQPCTWPGTVTWRTSRPRADTSQPVDPAGHIRIKRDASNQLISFFIFIIIVATFKRTEESKESRFPREASF